MNKTDEILKKWLAPVKKDSLPPVYMVGGAVRDYLLGRSANDIDLICRDAKETAALLASGRDAAVVPFEKKSDEPCYRVVDRLDKGQSPEEIERDLPDLGADEGIPGPGLND